MIKLGFKPLETLNQAMLQLDYRDLQLPTKEYNHNSNIFHRKKLHSNNKDKLNHNKLWKGWYKEESISEDDSDENEDDFEEMGNFNQRTRPRGKILHFIPSEKMKVLKGTVLDNLTNSNQ